MHGTDRSEAEADDEAEVLAPPGSTCELCHVEIDLRRGGAPIRAVVGGK